MSFGARALIRLGALKHNYSVIRSAAPQAKIMAVIKANAYGHGMVPVARSLPEVDLFAVARLPEALELRQNGVQQDVLLLAGVLDADEMQLAITHKLQLVVHCHEQIEILQQSFNGAAKVWLKFDTGMNRLGFAPSEAPALIQQLQHLECVSELCLMTHLSSADELDSPSNSTQLRRFQALTEDFDGAVSIGNSAASIGLSSIYDTRPGRSRENWIRTGIALYGVSPFAEQSAADLGLLPVMQFESRLIAIKPLAKGDRVGYKQSYRSESDTTLGIISAGYGDGYTRHFRSGTPVIVNGRRVALIGNVSMDMIAVDLGHNTTDRIGDIATLWGEGLPVEEVAPWANAIPYELVCGVMNREASEIIDQPSA